MLQNRKYRRAVDEWRDMSCMNGKQCIWAGWMDSYRHCLADLPLRRKSAVSTYIDAERKGRNRHPYRWCMSLTCNQVGSSGADLVGRNTVLIKIQGDGWSQ